MEELLTQVAREVERKYYGKYRGFVADNADPEQRGRLRLKVPSVLGDSVTGWALPCLPFGGLKDQGLFLVPEVDAQVWVEFEEGEVSQPLWTGTFWQAQGDPPAEAALDEPTTRLLKTPSGHLVQFDDADGEERLFVQHPAGTELEIDSAGTVALTDAGGNTVTLDAEAGELVIEDANGNTLTLDANGTVIEDSNGNKIEMAAAGITAKKRLASEVMELNIISLLWMPAPGCRPRWGETGSRCVRPRARRASSQRQFGEGPAICF